MLSDTQNYINNTKLVKKLINFVDFSEASLVVEIGPGKGIITDELLKHTGKIEIVEVDVKLFRFLEKKYKSLSPNKLLLILGDFLKYKLPNKPFLVVSNIPFNITAAVIKKLTGKGSKLQAAYLILQEKAAIKFIGAPHAHSPLFSHFLHIHYTVEKLMDIPKENYTPRPSFNTSFIIIKRRANPIMSKVDEDIFKDFLTFLFQKNKPLVKDCLKSLLSNLQTKLALSDLGIPEDSKTKKIAFKDWVHIFRIFQKHAPERAFLKIQSAYKKLVVSQEKLKKVHRTRPD